ncbi:hypothetical protein BDN72DRAFT_341473 [Pluteus cervinus]|uniref:Uncharacterized protein n=1 Tax=Pluteus cervinus TaxID=181527 RepID=A0ACD3ABH4_9AGAR|nr:hypothetical protein BDN72DRAFT_341473 [Pluteus cervinus]
MPPATSLNDLPVAHPARNTADAPLTSPTAMTQSNIPTNVQIAGFDPNQFLSLFLLPTAKPLDQSRRRKHNEVERRRRGKIAEHINILSQIVPNLAEERAKGSVIIERAIQYIHHVKDTEAANIEKWTLEKLLMDQAMGDVRAQLEEAKRLWEEERAARSRAEAELEELRSLHGVTTRNHWLPAGKGQIEIGAASEGRRAMRTQ